MVRWSKPENQKWDLPPLGIVSLVAENKGSLGHYVKKILEKCEKNEIFKLKKTWSYSYK